MNKIELADKRGKLYVEKMKLDRFFSMYLDKFGGKMDPEKTNTNIWKLYKAKLKEYSELDREIKSVEYWLSKNV